MQVIYAIIAVFPIFSAQTVSFSSFLRDKDTCLEVQPGLCLPEVKTTDQLQKPNFTQNSHDILERYLESRKLPELDHLIDLAEKLDDKGLCATNQCCQDLKVWRTNPNKKLDLLKAIDASSTHRAPNKRSGNLISSGSYNFCKKLGNNYCKYGLTNVDEIPELPVEYPIRGFHCVPESCNILDLNAIAESQERFPAEKANSSNPTNFVSKEYRYLFCYDRELKYGLSSYLWWEFLGFGICILWVLFLFISPYKNLNIYTCCKKLTDMKIDPRQLNTLNGLRVLSLIWVITGHSFAFHIQTAIKNIGELNYQWIQENPWLIVIIQGTFSVDNFFVIGGILTGYLFAKKYGKTAKNIGGGSGVNLQVVLIAILNRTLRLTPSIIMVIGVSILICYHPYNPVYDPFNNKYAFEDDEKTIPNKNYGVQGSIAYGYPGFDDQELWPAGQYGTQFQAIACLKLGWKSILNIIWADKGVVSFACLAHLWYVSCDYWIFVLIIIGFALLFNRNSATKQKLGYVYFIFMIVFSLAYNIGICFYERREFSDQIYIKTHPDRGYRKSEDRSYEDGIVNDLYFRPWTRWGPYIIGVLLGVKGGFLFYEIFYFIHTNVKLHIEILVIQYPLQLSAKFDQKTKTSDSCLIIQRLGTHKFKRTIRIKGFTRHKAKI